MDIFNLNIFSDSIFSSTVDGTAIILFQFNGPEFQDSAGSQGSVFHTLSSKYFDLKPSLDNSY